VGKILKYWLGWAAYFTALMLLAGCSSIVNHFAPGGRERYCLALHHDCVEEIRGAWHQDLGSCECLVGSHDTGRFERR
jgi:hypothetical protein